MLYVCYFSISINLFVFLFIYKLFFFLFYLSSISVALLFIFCYLQSGFVQLFFQGFSSSLSYFYYQDTLTTFFCVSQGKNMNMFFNAILFVFLWSINGTMGLSHFFLFFLFLTLSACCPVTHFSVSFPSYFSQNEADKSRSYF